MWKPGLMESYSVSIRKNKRIGQPLHDIELQSFLPPEQVFGCLDVKSRDGLDVSLSHRDFDGIYINVTLYSMQTPYFRLSRARAKGVIQRWEGTESRITLDLQPDENDAFRVSPGLILALIISMLIILPVMAETLILRFLVILLLCMIPACFYGVKYFIQACNIALIHEKLVARLGVDTIES